MTDPAYTRVLERGRAGETGSDIVVTRGRGSSRVMGPEFLSGTMKKSWRWTAVMAVQYRKCTLCR